VANLVGHVHRIGIPALALLALVELVLELLVEARQELHALLVTGFDFVELLLHAGRERRVHELELTSKEAVDDHPAELRGLEAAAVDLLDIVASLHLAYDLGVGAGATDAALFEFSYERALVVTRGRLRELLLGQHARRRNEIEDLAFGQLRQGGL